VLKLGLDKDSNVWYNITKSEEGLIMDKIIEFLYAGDPVLFVPKSLRKTGDKPLYSLSFEYGYDSFKELMQDWYDYEQAMRRIEMELREEEKEKLKQFVLDKRDKGEVVVIGLEGPISTSLENIIQQPADGILYDLNRLEEITLTFIDDPKWVNDFAVALVIRKLKGDLTQLKIANTKLLEENKILEAMVHWWETNIEPVDLGEYEDLIVALAHIRNTGE